MSASLVVLIPLVLLGLVTALCFVGCGLVYNYSGYHGLSPYQKAVTTDPNIVACWLLDDGGGPPPTKATDSGPHHFDGLYIGSVAHQEMAIVPNDPPSTCALFTGGFAGVGFQPLLNPQMSFSVEAWAQANQPTGFPMMVVASDDLTANTGYQLYATADNHWAAAIGLGPGSSPPFLIAGPDPMSPATVVFGAATYLVATFDGTTNTLTLYIDGQPAISKPATTPFVPMTSGSFAIGAHSSDGLTDEFTFNGKIQDVAFYGTALDMGTIKNRFMLGSTVQPDS